MEFQRAQPAFLVHFDVMPLVSAFVVPPSGGLFVITARLNPLSRFGPPKGGTTNDGAARFAGCAQYQLDAQASGSVHDNVLAGEC